jgi:hypothetical protein
MTRGRTAKPGVNVRSKRSEALLTAFSETSKKSLKDRVAGLEARVLELEEAVSRVPAAVPTYFYGGAVSEGKKKPGPAENISDANLFYNRDALVQWLEENWPKIIRPLLAANDPREVAAVLRQVARTPDLRPPWENEFVRHSAKLHDFLKSDRFTIKPPKKTVIDALSPSDTEKRNRAASRLPTRQIANAMAGVPKLKWRRSLDRCSENPSSLVVAYKTAGHYRTMFGIPEDKSR